MPHGLRELILLEYGSTRYIFMSTSLVQSSVVQLRLAGMKMFVSDFWCWPNIPQILITVLLSSAVILLLTCAVECCCHWFPLCIKSLLLLLMFFIMASLLPPCSGVPQMLGHSSQSLGCDKCVGPLSMKKLFELGVWHLPPQLAHDVKLQRLAARSL